MCILSALNINAEVYEGSCGTNVKYSLDTETGDLIITGTGQMGESFPLPLYSLKSYVKTAIISDGVTSMGSYTFSGYANLTSVIIGNDVASIGDYSFLNDCSLTSVTIGNSVTSIGTQAFEGCTSLASIAIPNSVTSIRSCAFKDCSSLITVAIPNSVISMENSVFRGCSNLISVTIPNSITRIEDGDFAGCSSLTSITIPNSITSIGDFAFQNCVGLASIEIPNSVTSIGGSAFQNCSVLTSVTIGNSVTSIGSGAFLGCSGLTSITLPNSVTSIGSGAFSRCYGLMSISIPNSVTNIGWYVFSDCSGLTSITIPSSVVSIGNGAFSGCSGLTSITIPNSVTSIGNQAFSGCSGLVSITVESGNQVYDSRGQCNAIVETSTNALIQGCKTTVIPYTVTSISKYAFRKCTSLTSAIIPNSVTSIGEDAFWGCGLSSIIIPNSVTLIGSGAFFNSPTLTDIYVVAKNPPSLEYNAFDSLVRLHIDRDSKDAYMSAVNWGDFNLINDIPLPLEISVNNVTRFYGDDNPLLTLNYTGFITGDDERIFNSIPQASTTATKTSDVGDYPVTISGGSISSFYQPLYQLIYKQGLFTVAKAPLSIKAINASKIYGEDNPIFDYVYKGFVNSETEDILITKPVGTTTATKTSPVGTYPITFSGGEATNYAFTYEQGELTVSKAGLTAKVKDATKVYGDENPSFDIEYVGLKNGETAPEWTTAPTIQTAATKTSDVGDYAIKANDAVAKNYDLAIADGKLTVTQAPLTITATNASRQYFDDEPAFEYSCTGFRNGDDKQALTKEPALVTEAEKTSAVGTYKITPSSAEAKNYAISYEQGELTITKRELKATSHASRLYGEENPTLPIEYTGFVNSETEDVLTTKPVATTTATKTSPVGTYPITVSGGEATNYAFTYEQGELTVSKAGLTAKVKDATKVYGDENPSFDIEYVGLKNGETVPEWTTAPTIQTAATKTSDVGDYAIKANDAVAKNYDLAIADGKLTVTPAPLTIKANDMTRLYYSENPSLDYTCNGFVNGDDKSTLSVKPNLLTLATLTSNVGNYDIEASGAVNPNYSISYEKGKLSVTPRTLTASVGNYERIYNEDNPAFEVTYTGFVGNEGESVITTKAVATTTATKTSDAGTYPIEVSGGGATNYIFSYNSGTLTINKAEQTISWEQDLTGLKVGEQIELKAESTSGLPVTYQMESNNVAEVYAAGAKWYLDCKADGEVQIVAMQEGNQNYYSSTRIRKKVVVGDDVTGIRAAKSEHNDNLPTYDTMGRKVMELKRGQVYIRQGKKFVVK